MYVNRLIEFSEANQDKLPPLGFKIKEINWIVDVEQDKFIFNSVKKDMSVPDITRTSNIQPILIADRSDYVFGFFDKDKDKERSKIRHKAYKELLQNYIDETEDQDTTLIMSLLDKEKPPTDMKMGDNIVFRIRDEDFIHNTPIVRKYWGSYVQLKVNDKSTVMPCMFCHKQTPIIKRHSIKFKIGRDNTKMITADKNAYESYGLKNSINAPTCYVCEQNYGKALEYLLKRHVNKDEPGGPHMLRVGDITYVYWVRGVDQINLRPIMSPTDKQSKEDMRDLLSQTFKGLKVSRNINDFCLLSLSSNKGRLVVRDYVEDSIGKIKESIETFFESQNIGHTRFYGIYTLAAAMYIEPRNQMQKYVLEEWMNWFLYGRAMSGRILAPLLKRIQAIGNMYPQQAAAVQSWLLSQKKGGTKEMITNEEKQSKAYLTGRVFAILEKIQREAINSENTIAAKYFGAASTTPQSIMGLLIRNSQYHLAKLKNTDTKKFKARFLEKDLGEILSDLHEFPSTLGMKEQGEFALGYYYEKQKSFTNKKETREQVK